MKVGIRDVLGGVGLMCLVGCGGHLNVGGDPDGGGAPSKGGGSGASVGGRNEHEGGSGGRGSSSPGGSGGTNGSPVGGSGGTNGSPVGGSGGTHGSPVGGSGGSEPEAETPNGPVGANGSPAESCDALLTSGVIAFDSDRADFNRDIYVVHPDGSGLMRLTDDPADDREPSLAPDGTTLAFTSLRDGTEQIFLLDIATKAVTQLTHRAGGASQPSFSPDGQLVAFHSGASLFMIGSDGTGEREMVTGSNEGSTYSWPQFSADGNELIYDRYNEILAVTLDGRDLRTIIQNWTTAIQTPAVSRNGAEIAYQVMCESARYSVWTAPIAQLNEPCSGGRRVTPISDRAARQPTWGPSQLIAYESLDAAGNASRIAVISREKGKVHCSVTEDGWDDRNPSWSVPR